MAIRDRMQQSAFSPAFGAEHPFNEMEVMELASELLTANNEAELEYFFGDLVKKAWSGIKSAAASPIGQAIVGGLKSVAKQALPQLGKAVGNYIAPGVGGAIGAKVASGAGSLLGLELEGLSAEDREFEVAKQLVNLAGAAAAKASAAPEGAHPAAVAKAAITEAAKTFAPGLLAHFGAGASMAPTAGGGGGRWYRRGNKIIIVGA